MGLWHAFSSTEKEKTMLNEKEFYQYVEANILNYLPEMEGKKVLVQRVKRNNQISMMGLSIDFIWMRIKFQIMSILRRICFIVWLIMRRIKRC